MNVGFLFNSDHPTFRGFYGYPIMRLILGTGVLQKNDRHMRISIGDVLTYSVVATSETPTRKRLVTICNEVYQPTELDLLTGDRNVFGQVTIYCWVFQNITDQLARSLHAGLLPNPAYLGAMDVVFSNRLHLSLFRNSLPEYYRLRGARCSIFYHLGENEDPDSVTKEIFEEYGFNVEYEDVGARHTIFDNYDTLDHFKRVEDFKTVFARFDGLDHNKVSDLAFVLEEIHPKLFDVLASAARTMARAQTEEDLAQASLSGRRLLEAVANYLFAARDATWKGRRVDLPAYKNRLWAYLEESLRESGLQDSVILCKMGREVDRLIELFNSGLHANPSKDTIEEAFRDLVVWLTRAIEISPTYARRVYLAYEEEIKAFAQKVIDSKIE
jgi:hypothetical protein